MPDRIKTLPQTKISHLKTVWNTVKIVKTTKLTIPNTQKLPGIPPLILQTSPVQPKPMLQSIKLFQDNLQLIITSSIFQSYHFRKITGIFYYGVNLPLKINLLIPLYLGVCHHITKEWWEHSLVSTAAKTSQQYIIFPFTFLFCLEPSPTSKNLVKKRHKSASRTSTKDLQRKQTILPFRLLCLAFQSRMCFCAGVSFCVAPTKFQEERCKIKILVTHITWFNIQIRKCRSVIHTNTKASLIWKKKLFWTMITREKNKQRFLLGREFSIRLSKYFGN